ncbi:MAG: hypothetical protein ACO1SV_24725 [Fimbriimonas sp.]
MLSLALLLPLVTTGKPVPLTIQMRVYDVPASFSISGRWPMPKPSKKGGVVSYLSPKPSEEQLAESARRGEIKALAAPLIRTLSDVEAMVTTTAIVEKRPRTGKPKPSIEDQYRVKPTVQPDGTILFEFRAFRSRPGKGGEMFLRFVSTMLIREGVPTYYLISPHRYTGRNILVTTRVTRS